MACYHPWTAYQLRDGTVVFVERGDVVKTLTLPCRQCVGCRLERSRQWAVRCMHEAQQYGLCNSFVTLTYNDEHLPPGNSLKYSDFQLFMKRLRKEFLPSRVRFYMAGEYGEELGRPHYHACLFGAWFRDREHLFTSGSGFRVYRSAQLERLWPLGHSSVGDVTFESAAYVARYVMKKITGQAAEAHYEVVDEATGEISKRVPEFNHMSLKPGIGAEWLEAFYSDVYPHGKVVVNGVECNPPRYYDQKFAELDVDGAAELSRRRDVASRAKFEDNSDVRLSVKEQVTAARVGFLKRSL